MPDPIDNADARQGMLCPLREKLSFSSPKTPPAIPILRFGSADAWQFVISFPTKLLLGAVTRKTHGFRALIAGP
jgi:hypothetical protein